MTAGIRIQALVTDDTRLVAMECRGGSDEAMLALFTAALAFMHAQPGGPGRASVAPPSPATAPPNKPRRRRP